MLDIDNFKNINDSYGHTVGDEVLIQLADMMREGVRESDMVGRYGGEEFLILLPNTELKKAGELAARLCKIIRETSIDVGKKTQSNCQHRRGRVQAWRGELAEILEPRRYGAV